MLARINLLSSVEIALTCKADLVHEKNCPLFSFRIKMFFLSFVGTLISRNTDCSAGHVVEGDVDPVLVALFSHGCDVLQRSGWRPLTGLDCSSSPPRYRNIS